MKMNPVPPRALPTTKLSIPRARNMTVPCTLSDESNLRAESPSCLFKMLLLRWIVGSSTNLVAAGSGFERALLGFSRAIVSLLAMWLERCAARPSQAKCFVL